MALVYGLGEAGRRRVDSAAVVAPLVPPAVCWRLFVLVQARVASPLLPLRILADRNRGGSFLTIILAVLGMYGTFLFLTYLLQTVDHYSPLKTGVAFLPLMVVNGAGRHPAGQPADGPPAHPRAGRARTAASPPSGWPC